MNYMNASRKDQWDVRGLKYKRSSSGLRTKESFYGRRTKANYSGLKTNGSSPPPLVLWF